MSTSLRNKLYNHILGMVERKTKLTAGFTEFYKENGGKEEVLKQLKLSKSGSWKKKLKELYPGEFSVSKKGTISRVGQSGASQPNVLAKNDSKSTAKLVMKVDQAGESSLESHIQNWIKKVEGFSGKAKGRKARKIISTDGVGKPCPTCNVQMVVGSKRDRTFMSTIEHIIPLSMGGDNTYTGEFPQLAAMCFACNQARNKVVQATKKSDLKGLVRFLITQVYGGVAESQSAFMDVFEDQYQIQTGRTLEYKVSSNQEIHLIQAGFCGNNAVPTANLIFEMFGSHPAKIIILLEQRYANLIDFEAWNPYAPEIILVPNGDDNLQLSALERVLSTTSKPVCMIHPLKSSQTFERLLQSNEVVLLNPIKEEKIGAQSSIKSILNGLMPWNWFARESKQLKSKPAITEKRKTKPETPPSETRNEVTSLSKSETAVLTTTKIESDGPSAILTHETPTPSQPGANPLHTLEWADDEQLRIILELKERLISDIYEKRQSGGEFTVLALAKTYEPYGGSAALKKKIGLPVNTKIKNMFSKLFGEVFVFTGEAPQLVINTLMEPNDATINDLDPEGGQSPVKTENSLPPQTTERDPESTHPVNEPRIEQEFHIIEMFRNQILEELKMLETTKLSMSDIRIIATRIKIQKELSWSLFHAHFGLEKRVQNWEAHFSTMLEMAGLEHTKESQEEVDWYHFSGNMLPLPDLGNHESGAVRNELERLHSIGWASPEQQIIIDEMRVSLGAAIQKIEQKGKQFEMKNLGQIYKPYGGSLAFKKKMGLLSSTKIKDMFFKLFGDEFIFSGTQPLWVISHSEEYLSTPHEAE